MTESRWNPEKPLAIGQDVLVFLNIHEQHRNAVS